MKQKRTGTCAGKRRDSRSLAPHQDDGLGSGLASMPDGGARLWTLALAAAAVCCLRPARACTVYDMYSTGLASSLCHMVPAVGLFGDNGTFFVNNHYFPCARPAPAQRWVTPLPMALQCSL